MILLSTKIFALLQPVVMDITTGKPICGRIPSSRRCKAPAPIPHVTRAEPYVDEILLETTHAEHALTKSVDLYGLGIRFEWYLCANRESLCSRQHHQSVLKSDAYCSSVPRTSTKSGQGPITRRNQAVNQVRIENCRPCSKDAVVG